MQHDRAERNFDRIAYRVKSTTETGPGVAFFSIMRSWKVDVDAFYTSKTGIEDIRYIGNAALVEFNGHPRRRDEEADREIASPNRGWWTGSRKPQ